VERIFLVVSRHGIPICVTDLFALNHACMHLKSKKTRILGNSTTWTNPKAGLSILLRTANGADGSLIMIAGNITAMAFSVPKSAVMNGPVHTQKKPLNLSSRQQTDT
jgi:hypothetical protein